MQLHCRVNVVAFNPGDAVTLSPVFVLGVDFFFFAFLAVARAACEVGGWTGSLRLHSSQPVERTETGAV